MKHSATLQAVTEIDAATQQNAALVEQAARLTSLVGVFRLDGEHAVGMRPVLALR